MNEAMPVLVTSVILLGVMSAYELTNRAYCRSVKVQRDLNEFCGRIERAKTLEELQDIEGDLWLYTVKLAYRHNLRPLALETLDDLKRRRRAAYAKRETDGKKAST